MNQNSPSNEWQDRVVAMLQACDSATTCIADSDSGYGTADQQQNLHQLRLRTQQSEPSLASSYTNSVSYPNSSGVTHPNRYAPSHSHSLPASNALTPRIPQRVNSVEDDPLSPSSRRQRRRLELDVRTENSSLPTNQQSLSSHTQAPYTYHSPPSSERQRHGYETSHSQSHPHSAFATRRLSVSSSDTSSAEDGDGDGELAGAVGQLSLNEEQQVRYHGKASGLHLLGVKERVDKRNEGGIWFVCFFFLTYLF